MPPRASSRETKRDSKPRERRPAALSSSPQRDSTLYMYSEGYSRMYSRAGPATQRRRRHGKHEPRERGVLISPQQSGSLTRSSRPTLTRQMSMTVMLMALKSMEKKYRKSTEDLTAARQRLGNAERTLKRNDEALATQLKTVAELEYTVSSQARDLTRARVACDEAFKQRDAARRELETQAAQLQQSGDECVRLRNDLSRMRSRVSALEGDNAELRAQAKAAAKERARMTDRYSSRRKSQDMRSHFSSKLLELQSLLIQEQDAPSDAVKNSAIHQQARILSLLTEAAASRSSNGASPASSRPQTPTALSRASHKRLRVTASSSDSSSSSALFTPTLSRSTPNFPHEAADPAGITHLSHSSHSHSHSHRTDSHRTDSHHTDSKRSSSSFPSKSLFSDRDRTAAAAASSPRHLNGFRSRPSSANSQGKQQHEDDRRSDRRSMIMRTSDRDERNSAWPWKRRSDSASALTYGGIFVSVGLGALALIVMQAHRSSARAKNDSGSQEGCGATETSGVLKRLAVSR